MTAYGAPQLAHSFRTVRANTVQIAEDIPESKYDYVAAPGTQSVASLLKHIAFGPTLYEDMHRHKRVTTLKGYDFPGVVAKARAEEAKPRSKAEIVAVLKSEGERFAKWLESLTPEFLAEMVSDPTGEHSHSRLTSLHSPKEHEMHHRGQLMLIERMLGIVPHLTRAREARQAQQAQAKS
ncbi:MAG TPA: DinB family protein [Gemmatimonadaceae bacterium]